MHYKSDGVIQSPKKGRGLDLGGVRKGGGDDGRLCVRVPA